MVPGGLVFEAHRLLHHSAEGSRTFRTCDEIKEEKAEEEEEEGQVFGRGLHNLFNRTLTKTFGFVEREVMDPRQTVGPSLGPSLKRAGRSLF